MKVHYFLRKRLPFGHFSVEFIFEDVCRRLQDKLQVKIYTSSYFSQGFFKRLYNTLEATFRQGDVNHITGDIHYIALFLNKRKTILTILDCGFLAGRKGLAAWLLKYFWLDMPVRKSRYVTTISEYTRQEVLRYTGCTPDKVVVVPVAISTLYKPVAKDFNHLKPNLLQIGRAPNKNFERIVEAVSGLSVHLILIGNLSEPDIELLHSHNIEYSNYFNISDEEMREMYAVSDILMFPSTLEGFGMPILEAQSVGRAVLTSNITSMPEVAGDAACLVNPFSTEDIRAGLIRLIKDQEYREELIEKGFSNIKRYDPDYIANMYYQLYERIAPKDKNL